MFKRNHRHLQIPLTSHVDDLPEKLRKRLENSWAGVFYREFFCRLDETPFDVLYADFPSRPNEPVNVMVGLEYLKAGNGWTDEELYDNFCYDIQVRYALGYRQLGEGDPSTSSGQAFDLRTLYYFRERLSRHMQEKGVNLLDEAFKQVTDKQIAAYQLKTGKQRMDSTQVASNIRQMGRVQLLVEVLQRVQRMLNEADQQHYGEAFAPYLKGHAGHYVYRMKREETGTHLQRIGEFMQRLLSELKPAYAAEPVYQVLERVFGEHFQVKETAVETKPNEALSAVSLQSPDDLEATYREKRGQGYQGYVANLTETCDPENQLQLITKVQTAPNATDDSQLLAEALPDLKERTGLETIYTDGGHGGPQADKALQEQHVEHLQTAIRGRIPNPDKLHLSDFTLKLNEDGKPVGAICPEQQSVPVQTSSQQKAFVAHFAAETCAACPLLDKCLVQLGKRDAQYHLRFTQTEAQASERRRRSQEQRKESRNLRAAVEATVRSVKHPFPAGKLPVRGKFRVACMLIGSAAIANIGRIQRYLEGTRKAEKLQNTAPGQGKIALQQPGISFCAFAKTVWATLCRLAKPPALAASW